MIRVLTAGAYRKVDLHNLYRAARRQRGHEGDIVAVW